MSSCKRYPEISKRGGGNNFYHLETAVDVLTASDPDHLQNAFKKLDFCFHPGWGGGGSSIVQAIRNLAPSPSPPHPKALHSPRADSSRLPDSLSFPVRGEGLHGTPLHRLRSKFLTCHVQVFFNCQKYLFPVRAADLPYKGFHDFCPHN